MTKRKKTLARKVNRGKLDERGSSKYSLKIERRRRIAARLGLSDMPFPVLELQNGYKNH